MPRTKSQDIFLTVILESSHPDSSLNLIELQGVPGKNQNGQYILSDAMFSFFDDTIGRPLFAASRCLPTNWQKLTIWLYPTDENSLEYQIPRIDERDLKIESNVSGSSLQFIYVLDNDLKGLQYRQWKTAAKAMFSPLFKKFAAPPQLPSSLAFNPFSDFIESLDSRLDPYAKMKRELFFDALIVQID